MTALGQATNQLNIPMIKLLLNAGANPEVLDNDYRTARERMPSKETSDPKVWSVVAAMLGY
ncbi:MAG: hypothetical protein F6K47_36285 [Symploca sp. SIO2E6]|nr:hypothetical protein [Symploca sp. SIO2E6]